LFVVGSRNKSMKKQMLILVASLMLSNNLIALDRVRGEHCFRPAFQKKLKRVKSVRLHSFTFLKLNKNKKTIFIDWRKLYWGKLGDLIYGVEETYDDNIQDKPGTEEKASSSFDTEESLVFAKELRQELRSFARQYNLKIVWWKKSPDLQDATSAFLEYWDKGFSQEEQAKVISFSELCALSVRHTNPESRSVHNLSTKKGV
jgi:hypothetical protein